MNELIKSLFDNFTVEGARIPVAFLYYEGHDDAYITFQQTDADASLSGDDDLEGYVDFYDFDVFTKGNNAKIISEVKRILKAAGFTWQPSRSSRDMYETETKLYHKTLCFAIHRMEEN